MVLLFFRVKVRNLFKPNEGRKGEMYERGGIVYELEFVMRLF